ncbi:turgor pressure sensor kinase KdpD [Nocardia brasiliensis NBRC 14402]|uniref:sensor histidine kinase n=1 Tax=Nocardia brasiliensis TaxID=37326 RepID=UPI0002E48F3E|nr:sensor histidine kinase KdpD [Nocardia brasiliensis]ASF12567.1 sensor histidine kinase KdpD [Nocardia brasiliensis]GAJ79842.1 turgor pressure sensor kinase KdpD [Nocardia brasiliensis NBRC 14402]SUB53572.1 Sensor protein KdpD [Nocardia brasiliensis]
MKRGQLRIYLGAAPGVGKTYAMLGEAHRRLERGRDVVAAVVETHGRAKTAALLEGIERIPARTVRYRGAELPELDVEAVLRRRPTVALVDELAHTNAPGSKHEKRWQDVEELLDAGIDVISTVNVQHLESLNDVVEQITGIQQKETVPDAVVRGADQVELVDLTPEALRRRLSHGNVYAADKVDAALRNYFRPGNLTALRELALLWLADQVDAALAKYRADHKITELWEARERVVVAVTGGPESETVVRRASRIASKASAELVLVHVVRGDGLAGVSTARLARLRELAGSLDASLHTVTGDDVPTALLEFAREVNATQLVLGTSRRSRWARMLDEGIGSTVVQQSGKIDVHMVTHEEAHRGLRRSSFMPRQPIRAWLAAVLVPMAVCGIGIVFLDGFLQLGGLSAVFFIGVVAVALLGGVVPAAFSALLSGLLLNWFFADPRYSLTISEPDNFVTVVVLLFVAVAVAALVDVAAKQTLQARRASQEAELLTMFAGAVLHGADLPNLLEQVRETYGQRAVSMLCGEQVVAEVGADPPQRATDADTTIQAGDATSLLLLAGRPLAAGDRPVLNAVANQAAGLVRQSRLAEEASAAAALLEADRLRRALLSAVSHDLRTPLAGAKAAVSSLRSDDIEFSAEDTGELLETIEESVDQLTALVGNLLDSSRLAVGVVKPQLRQVYMDEVVHRALVSVGMGARGLRRAAMDRVKVEVGDVSVRADSGLLERVVANLIDNALRHATRDMAFTQPGGAGDYHPPPVRVTAEREGDRVSIAVVDTGPGVPPGAEEQLFEPFQRLGDRDNTTGVGLGLSVVRGFVEAMGGTVHAEPTPGGGLTMIVDLPAAANGASSS